MPSTDESRPIGTLEALRRWRPLLSALALMGCTDGDRSCPESWEASNEGTSCRPPPEVVSSAERDLGTGIFGYALGCYAQNDEDECGCRIDGLVAEETTFQLVEVYEDGGWTDELVNVRVRSDATFQAPLVPGKRYRFVDAPMGYGIVGDGTLEEFPIAEGEVLFMRVVVMVSC